MHLVPLQLLTSGLFLTFTILHNMGIKERHNFIKVESSNPKLHLWAHPQRQSGKWTNWHMGQSFFLYHWLCKKLQFLLSCGSKGCNVQKEKVNRSLNPLFTPSWKREDFFCSFRCRTLLYQTDKAYITWEVDRQHTHTAIPRVKHQER